MGQTRWTPDGTQSLPPPAVFADPLAGLVTGVNSGAAIIGDPFGEPIVPVAAPVEPDAEQSRALVAALFAADDELPQGRPVALPPPPGAFAGGLPPGMVAPPEKLPARQRMRNALGANKDSADGREAFRRRRQQLMAARPRGSQDGQAGGSNVSGIVIALVLIAVFGFIALQAVAGFAESMSDVFE